MTSPSPWIHAREAMAEAWVEEAVLGIRDTYVYRYYDDADRLLYVGQTNDLQRRESAHRNNAHWHSAAARKEVQGPFPKALALCFESEALTTESPLHNRSLANGHRGPGSWQWEAAAADEFRRAMEADPHLAEAHRGHMRSLLEGIFAAT